MNSNAEVTFSCDPRGIYTKEQEIRRTLEVCKDILMREGINDRGILLLTYFLRDQGRPLNDLLEVWHSQYAGKKSN